MKPLITNSSHFLHSFDKVIEVAPDKSISHRSLIFAAIADGVSKIYNLLEGEDVINTAKALKSMGVEIIKQDKYWQVSGVGLVGLSAPNNVFDMGNSGTSTRLLSGLVTPYNFTSFFTGDESLRKRPMARIFKPITQFGATINARDNNLLPFSITGPTNPLPIDYTLENASAQVKSCILLASLATRGRTTIYEPELCRDHTEIMMKHLGLKINITDIEVNNKIGKKIEYKGFQEFAAQDFNIPGDISSAAFFIVATLISKNSQIIIKNTGLNKLRTGIITTLQEMGGDIQIDNMQEIGGELVGDIIVRSSNLKGVEVPSCRSSSMIDEYPILAIAAANAVGVSKMDGLGELKVKESNRLLLTCNNLNLCGVEAKIDGDSLIINGGIKQPRELVKINSSMDHRIAMSFFIMGLKINAGIEIDDSSMIATSFPNFLDIFANLGVIADPL
jgi:3-phosphoshikimate 1-carboxyvinyltransferase